MVTIVGAGNVATWMAQRLQGSNQFPVTQVYSRHIENAESLAALSGAQAIDDIRQLDVDNQMVVFALADNAYEELLPKLPSRIPAAFITSGTVSCQCLKDFSDAYGVIYPLQTFTKSQDMRMLEVPLCLESDFVRDRKDAMWELARELSPLCYEVSEEQRARMHLAAVFACNFSNAMYDVAYNLLTEKNIPFDVLMPVLRQTVNKLTTMTPKEAQTGPAVRRDVNVMRAQLAELDDERLRELYRLISEMIFEAPIF